MNSIILYILPFLLNTNISIGRSIISFTTSDSYIPIGGAVLLTCELDPGPSWDEAKIRTPFFFYSGFYRDNRQECKDMLNMENYAFTCDGPNIYQNISNISFNDFGTWQCFEIQNTYQESVEVVLYKFVQTKAPNITGSLEVFPGNKSDLRCHPDPAAQPLSTLTWYKDDIQIDTQDNVPHDEWLQLNYTYTTEDNNAVFFCTITQNSSYAIPMQSEHITLILLEHSTSSLESSSSIGYFSSEIDKSSVTVTTTGSQQEDEGSRLWIIITSVLVSLIILFIVAGLITAKLFSKKQVVPEDVDRQKEQKTTTKDEMAQNHCQNGSAILERDDQTTPKQYPVRLSPLPLEAGKYDDRRFAKKDPLPAIAPKDVSYSIHNKQEENTYEEIKDTCGPNPALRKHEQTSSNVPSLHEDALEEPQSPKPTSQNKKKKSILKSLTEHVKQNKKKTSVLKSLVKNNPA